MHFHVPKPLHGWREFAGEVGIIVLGVLIAISAEQAVEQLHWHEAVAANEAAMNEELADDRARWDRMIAVRPCALRRLNEIERWSRTAPASAHFEDVPGPSIWSSRTSAWQMVRGADIATHISLDRRLAYSEIYDHLTTLQPYLDEEQRVWWDITSELRTADDPQSRRELRRSIVHAEILARGIQHNFVRLAAQFEQLGIQSASTTLPKPNLDPEICHPLSTWH